MAAMLEKITANIELTELKKFKLQKAILTLMLEWKHLEEYMDSTQHSFHECLDQLQHKEDHLNSLQESVTDSNKHLDSVRLSLEERVKQLDDKERELVRFRDQFVKDLDLKEQQLGLIGKSIEERVKEVEFREEKVKVDFKVFKVEEKRFEEFQDSTRRVIRKRMEELDDKEREFNVFRDEQVKELDLRGKELEGKIKQVELREELVDIKEREFDVKEKDFERRVRELDAKEEDFERRARELDTKETDFERRVKEVNAKEAEFERSVKEVNAKYEDFGNNRKEFEYKEKDLIGPVRETESLAKETSNVNSTNVKMVHELEDNLANNSSSGIQFFAKIDGKGLQSFLNQREKDHHLMAEEVYNGLRMSSDPAKLVLDAMEGFYCHPNKRNTEFQLNVTRKSCILLLEQLQRISPKLSPQVKVEAMKLVWQLKPKWRPIPTSMEVLGILYLLASYRLPIPFDDDELLGLFMTVAECRQTPELCRTLGFTHHVPDLICNLLRKNHILVAVRFISEFGLVDEFSPALLLKDYVKQLKIKSRNVLMSNNTRTSKHAVIVKRVAALRKVIRCITDHKLESMYSPKSIKQSIEDLLKMKGDNKCIAPPPSTVKQEKRINKSMPSINPVIISNPLSTAPSSSKPFTTKIFPVTDMAFILANMDGECLQFFLYEHFEDHEVLCNVVLLALQHSSDPGRLVLDAMQGFHRQYGKVRDVYFEVAVIRSSCILLLEQLMRLQVHLQPQMKGEAMIIAHHWESSMRDEIENPQVILVFLQFIAAFGLTSSFDNDVLHPLFHKIAPHPHARELCQLLGFEEKTPGCVLHPRRVSSEGSLSDNTPLERVVDFVNVSPKHGSNSLRVNMEGNNQIPMFHYVSDPAKLVLDAIRGCYHSIMEKGANCPKEKMMDKFSSLLEWLIGISRQITSQVQEQATAFSVGWKSNLSVCRKNEAEVKAFLHLLAAYELSSSLMYTVLHALLNTYPAYKNKLELYRQLNIADKTSDFIQYLIENDARILAIKFIYEFELVEKFPPVPILKSHLRFIEKICKKICEEGDYSPQALDKAADKEIGLLRGVIRCLIFHRIKCDCTPENLEVVIDHIQKQKEYRKMMQPPSGGSMVQKKRNGRNKRGANFEGEQQKQKEEGSKRARINQPPPPPPPPPLKAGEDLSGYPINQTKEVPNHRGLPTGQDNGHELTTSRQYYDGFNIGGRAQLGGGRQYGPNTGGAYCNNGVPMANNMIPRGTSPYLYPPPWHQP